MLHAPLVLPTHPMPRSLAVRHTHASACLCTAQPVTQPHPNLADSRGAVCAAARRSWSLLSVFPTSQELACVSFCGLWSHHRHVACITSGHGGVMMIGKCVRSSFQHVCNVDAVEEALLQQCRGGVQDVFLHFLRVRPRSARRAPPRQAPHTPPRVLAEPPEIGGVFDIARQRRAGAWRRGTCGRAWQGPAGWHTAHARWRIYIY
jgi:hypothetical protein